jgi:DNA-binding transcriptional LysR family regulator
MLNLNHLPTFLAVVEQGSISRAAERLHLSQSAVSGQIAELEAALGQRLLDRLPRRGVALTAAGEAFRERVVVALDLVASGERAVHDLEHLEAGGLVIGASSTTGTYLLPMALSRFARRFPRIELSLVIANSAAVVERLRQGELDLAITEDDSEHIDCQRESWLRDEIVLIAPAGHPLAGQTAPMTPAALEQQVWVHREAGSGTLRMVAAALGAAGCRLPPGPRVGSIEALKRAVLAGLGLAWISELAVADELRRGELVRIPVEGLRIQRRHDLVALRGRARKPAAQAFVSLLREFVVT